MRQNLLITKSEAGTRVNAESSGTSLIIYCLYIFDKLCKLVGAGIWVLEEQNPVSTQPAGVGTLDFYHLRLPSSVHCVILKSSLPKDLISLLKIPGNMFRFMTICSDCQKFTAEFPVTL